MVTCHTTHTALLAVLQSNDLYPSPPIMKPREYCCCAIPLVNAGIYLTLVVQVVASLLVGILAVATPSSEYDTLDIPVYMLIIQFSSCRGVNALICILDIGYHLLCCHRSAAPRIYWCCQGKLRLTLFDKHLTMLRLQGKTILYRRYVTLHGIAIMAAFSVAAAWIILSATRHSDAQAKCIQDFFSSTGSASNSSEGEALCNIFSWVDIGIMGALWVLLAILQVSLFIRCLSIYF